jgi:proteasome lid subunit RPN8/RPN11
MSSIDVRAIDAKDLRKQPSPLAKQEFRVFLSEPAFDRAVARGDSDTTREIGGVLVGELLRDDAGPYLRIDGTVDALHAEEKGAELTFTHATWEHIHKEMDGKHKDKRVVGWYHTHPGFGVFLSDRDQFIHKSFFNLPFQVAFVYDPKSREHGMFTWHDNEVRRVRHYWVGPREQVWDGSRTPPSKPDKRAEPAASGRSGPEASQHAISAAVRDDGLSGQLGGLIVLGIAVLAIGGFVGHWIGTSSANQVLGEARNEIAKAKLDGAQAMTAALQSDLVRVLRDTMGDDAVHRPIAQAVGEIDRVIAALPVIADAAQLRAARDNLARLAQDRATATAALAQLERATRRSGELRTDLSRDVADQRAGLSGLYAELAGDAAKLGDVGRVRRLLATAARLDPGNRARYEKQLQAVDKTASLPRDTTDIIEATESAGPGSQQ